MEWDVNLSLSSGQRIVVPQVPFLIGRAAECDFRLNRKQVDKRHCRIQPGVISVPSEDEDDEEGAQLTVPSICIVQLSKNLNTTLNGDILKPQTQVFLVLDEEHVLVVGDEPFQLIVQRKEHHSRRGPYRHKRSPGSMAINRGGKKKERHADEFDDTLRERRRDRR